MKLLIFRKLVLAGIAVIAAGLMFSVTVPDAGVPLWVEASGLAAEVLLFTALFRLDQRAYCVEMD